MDYFIFQQINNLAGQWTYLDALGIFFAEYLAYVLVVLLFFFFWKEKKVIFQSLLAGFLARFGLVELIRLFWLRPRPFVGNEVNLLLEHNGASFPSGHAAFFFAISTVIFLYYKKVYPASKFWCGASIGFFVASFLIAISRVFCGIHWPSDILAGALVGVFSGWLILKFFKK